MNKFLGIAAVGFISLLAYTADVSADAVIFVAPDGDDQNSGTIESPLRSPHAAQFLARKMKSDTPQKITVYFRGGTYELPKPLSFTIEDSGTRENPVLWAAYQSEQPVFSGGVNIQQWQEGKNGIWSAHFESGNALRQLYVNDRAAILAEHKKTLKPTGWSGDTFTITGEEPWTLPSEACKVNSGFAFALEDFPKLAHPEDLEMMQFRTWNMNRLGIETVRYENDWAVVLLEQPGGALAIHQKWGCGLAPDKPCVFYNAYEFIDEPGEFYYDRHSETLYYKARQGENMATARSVVPVLETLVDISGKNLKSRIHDLEFRGITFAHSKWDMIKIGNSVSASTIQSTAYNYKFKKNGNWHIAPYPLYRSLDIAAAAVAVNSADRIFIESCNFMLLGSLGIKLENDVNHARVRGCVFYDIEGAAINIGHPHHAYIGRQNGDNWGHGPYNIDNSNEKWDETVEGLPRFITISNNLIRKSSTVWWNHAPLTVYFGESIHIVHNDIKNSPYNAVSLGWGWSELTGWAYPRDSKIYARDPRYNKQAETQPTYHQRDFICSYNKITNHCRVLNDGGLIYFLNYFAVPAGADHLQSEYSKIMGNHLISEDVHNHVYTSTLHTDQGSSFLDIRNNVIDAGRLNLKLRIQEHGRNTAYKKFIDNFTASSQNEELDNTIDEQTLTIRNTHFQLRDHPNEPLKLKEWPEPAQKIISNAGLQTEYEHLHEKLPYTDTQWIDRLLHFQRH